ncbi:MAG: hypothetical protein AAGI03_03140 [Pseudomonadota bacterium]
MDQNQPLHTIRDGRLKATIWENVNDKNEIYHTVTLAKTYEDRNGKLQDSHSFSSSELLRVAKLADESHGVIRDVRREISREQSHQKQTKPAQDDRPSRFRQNTPQPRMDR